MSKQTKVGLAAAAVGAGAAIYFATRAEAAPPLPPVDKATLWGVVTDADTGNPINGIKASLNSWLQTTGTNGRYEFPEVDPGTYSLVFSDPEGVYETLEV